VKPIDPEDPLVGVHQREWIELDPRRVRQHRHHAQVSCPLAGSGRGGAEHSEAAGGREQAITLLERVSPDRIENELNASPTRDLTRSLLEVLGPIVNQVIDT
jgi:hypothetical protein